MFYENKMETNIFSPEDIIYINELQEVILAKLQLNQQNVVYFK